MEQWIGVIVLVGVAYLIYKGIGIFQKKITISDKGKIVIGVVQFLSAVGFFAWVMIHSPSSSSSWRFNETMFILFILLSVIYGVWGVGNMVIGTLNSASKAK